MHNNMYVRYVGDMERVLPAIRPQFHSICSSIVNATEVVPQRGVVGVGGASAEGALQKCRRHFAPGCITQRVKK